MIDIQSLDIYQLEQLRDAINRRLLQMRRTEGLRLPELLQLFEEVKTTLQGQGKEWHSLERWQWMDGGIKFWLNPNDQDLYHTGWFSIDELIAWTYDSGPVMIEEDVEVDEEAGPYQQAGGVSITWLPKSRGSSTSDREDTDLRLI
ncbi:MAG TPA: hypothetical protein VF897_22135 [Roseiflexaceae bacterium]